MIALLSIKPEYVEKIFSGEKTYEYRKYIFKQKIDKIIVYCTSPVSRIVGEFDIESIIEDDPVELWNKTKKFSGVKKVFFREYFKGRNKGYAIKIGKTNRYKTPINPYEEYENFNAPQGFHYIEKLPEIKTSA